MQLICQGWSSFLALIAKVLVTKNSNFNSVLLGDCTLGIIQSVEVADTVGSGMW